MIIERHLAHAISDTVELLFPPEGVVCVVHIPPAQLVGLTVRTAGKTPPVPAL